MSPTFAALERAGGAPIELYTFQRGQSVWRYVSGDVAQIVAGLTYTPANIRRGKVQQKQDTPGTQVEVTLPLATSFAQSMLTETSAPAYGSIQRLQVGATGAPIKQTLLGRIVQVKFAAFDMTVTIATAEYDFQQQIPRITISRTCPWAVYSPNCGVDKAAFAHDTTIDAITGQVISVGTLADSADDVYTNGVLRIAATGQLLFVAKQAGLALTVWNEIPSEAVDGASVTVYMGCDKQFATCETKFNNATNFGGFPDLPTVNPATTQLK
jgi:hypothetical protein